MAHNQLMKVRDLIQQARFHPAAALPTETHQSYPIPVHGKNELWVEFLYSLSHVSMQSGLQLMPPSYVAFLDAETGAFEEMRKVTPKELGQQHAANQYIGKYMLPPGMSQEAFLAKQSQLYDHYDVLLPLFASGQTRALPEVERVADEFRRLFLEITEPPLEPYYSEVGKDFFRWLHALIR